MQRCVTTRRARLWRMSRPARCQSNTSGASLSVAASAATAAAAARSQAPSAACASPRSATPANGTAPPANGATDDLACNVILARRYRPVPARVAKRAAPRGRPQVRHRPRCVAADRRPARDCRGPAADVPGPLAHVHCNFSELLQRRLPRKDIAQAILALCELFATTATSGQAEALAVKRLAEDLRIARGDALEEAGS